MEPTQQVFAPALVSAIVTQDRALTLAGAILANALDHDDVAIAVMPEFIADGVEKPLHELWAATPAGRLFGRIRIVRRPEGGEWGRMVVELGA